MSNDKIANAKKPCKSVSIFVFQPLAEKKGGFMRLFLIIALSASVLFGQILYEEHFTGGTMQLDWHPWFVDTLGIGDSMQVMSDPTTPEGDGWAGKILNEHFDAGASYAGTNDLDDYSIEAYIYTTVTAGSGGPYNGLTIRMDTITGRFYRFVSDFDSNARLRLALYIPSEPMPTVITLRDWESGEIPGGVPAISSWHKFKLMMVADSIWAYYDGFLLPDCPILNDSIAQGFFGVYLFNMMEPDSVKCDSIIVKAEGTGIAEHEAGKLTAFTVYPNPFIGKTDIRYQITDGGTAELKIYDVSGRLVKQFNHLTMQPSNQVSWDGRDERGSVLAPGVYFITANNVMLKAVKLR